MKYDKDADRAPQTADRKKYKRSPSFGGKMTHPWVGNVIAGVENPRVLIVGPELISNKSFEENLTGWSQSGNGMTRVQNTTTPFGNYIMDLEDDNAAAHEHAYQTINYGSVI